MKKEMKKTTMNDLYRDGSNHLACRKCGLCLTCGDCICKIKILKA